MAKPGFSVRALLQRQYLMLAQVNRSRCYNLVASSGSVISPCLLEAPSCTPRLLSCRTPSSSKLQQNSDSSGVSSATSRGSFIGGEGHVKVHKPAKTLSPDNGVSGYDAHCRHRRTITTVCSPDPPEIVPADRTAKLSPHACLSSTSSFCSHQHQLNLHVATPYPPFSCYSGLSTDTLSASSSSRGYALSQSDLLRLSSPRLSGAPKPTWKFPTDQLFHPQIPDKHHYMDNPSLSTQLLFWRSMRPYLEKIGRDVYCSGRRLLVDSIWDPCVESWKRHNPEFRLELVALFSFFAVQYLITLYYSQTFQYIVDIRNGLVMHHARNLHESGFFDSESELMEKKAEQYAEDHQRLTSLWNEALSEATVQRSFDLLCSKLPVKDEAEIPTFRDYDNQLRFNMMPYGKGEGHTETFPVPDREQPLRAFSLNFTYNNLSGDWGDYVDRKDNKSAPLRRARPMFTDIYIPGTK